MKYTADKYRYLLFTLSACNGRAGSGAHELALHYILVGRADSKVFWQLQRPFQEAGSVIAMPLVNVVCSWTVQALANEGAIFAAVKQEQ